MDNKKIGKLDQIKQLFIIGGGYSIKPHLQELQTKLKDKFTISLNYAFRDFPDATIQCFTDVAYWKEQRIHKDLLNLPLIIAKNHGVKYSPNIISLNVNTKEWNKDLKEGIFCPSLTGTFAIALGLYLIEGEIILFGFDGGVVVSIKDKYKRNYTHYNQDTFRHRGTAGISYYNNKIAMDKSFIVFKNENVINVGLTSKIPFFKKISYSEFFEMIDENVIDQNEMRNEIKNKLNTLDT